HCMCTGKVPAAGNCASSSRLALDNSEHGCPVDAPLYGNPQCLESCACFNMFGGRITGGGIARDAAGRGLAVYLCEMGDLASGTSSRSTGLIHGGLRYLEYYDFRLVREALREREVLLRIAPQSVRPLRIVLPYRRGLRPAWLLRLAPFLLHPFG